MQQEKFSKRKALTIITAVFVAVMLLPCVSVFAQNHKVVTSVQTITSGQLETYWTEKRMREAKPMPFPVASASNRPAGGIATTEPSRQALIAYSGLPGDKPYETKVDSSTLSELATPQPIFGIFPFSYTRYRLFPDSKKSYKIYPYRLIGQLFFMIPGMGDFVCSASVINSANFSTVWTAGHCVATPGIGFHTNVIFVPAENKGRAPFRIWTANTLFAIDKWVDNGLLEYDNGAVVVNRGGKHNARIGEELGFLGFLTDASRMQHWHLAGYPVAPRDLNTTPPGPQFDGLHQEICAAAFATNDQPTGTPGVDPQTIGVGCDQTGGASGGPWLVDLSGLAGAVNFVNGNNSYKYNDEPNNVYGPYFTTGATNVRNAAQGVVIP
jgi:V8-like Glu-specific endopeptidase